MTKLYLDTEFNGFGGALMSMALISAEGSAWYEVVDVKGPIDPWVKQHVVPLFDKAPVPLVSFKASLHMFLRQFVNPEIICDWHADAAHFCDSLAGFDYGSSLDYACRITILKTPPGEPKPKRPHNALSDATALMMWAEGRV